MNYNGIKCPVCSEIFADGDDVVVCPVCGTPQHRNCWLNNGGCINEEKHEEGFVWEKTEEDALLQLNNGDGSEKLKRCARCGELNQPFEPVCTRCGERLKANAQTVFDQMPFEQGRVFGGYGENVNPNNFSPYQNVYAADARTVYGEDAKIDDIPVTEIAEFVQKKSTAYIGKFLNMQEKKTKVSVNLSSGFFTVFWCFYRKMTGCGIALLAILFSAFLISSAVPPIVYEKFQPEIYADYENAVTELSEITAEAQTTGVIPNNYSQVLFKCISSPIMISSYVLMILSYILVGIVFCFFGNYFYKRKILKEIKKIRQISADSTTYHMYIRYKGGVSIANVIVPIMLYSFFNMILSYI